MLGLFLNTRTYYVKFTFALVLYYAISLFLSYKVFSVSFLFSSLQCIPLFFSVLFYRRDEGQIRLLESSFIVRSRVFRRELCYHLYAPVGLPTVWCNARPTPDRRHNDQEWTLRRISWKSVGVKSVWCRFGGMTEANTEDYNLNWFLWSQTGN